MSNVRGRNPVYKDKSSCIFGVTERDEERSYLGDPVNVSTNKGLDLSSIFGENN